MAMKDQKTLFIFESKEGNESYRAYPYCNLKEGSIVRVEGNSLTDNNLTIKKVDCTGFYQIGETFMPMHEPRMAFFTMTTRLKEIGEVTPLIPYITMQENLTSTRLTL